MPRHVQGLGLDFANSEAFVGLEQVIELRAVEHELGLEVEHRLEHLLHLADLRANGDAAAQLRAQVGRGRQVVSVGVGFQQPLHG